MEFLSDLIAVETQLDISTNGCSNNNGGCSHLCLAEEPADVGTETKTRCSCPHNLVLQSDSLNCADPPTCSPEEFTCKSGSVSCIPHVWRCDNMAECEDESDEEDCPPCNKNQFLCGSGECLDNALRCDETPQCRDRSDEENCCKDGPCPVSSCEGPHCPNSAPLQPSCTGDHCTPATTKARHNATHYAIAIVVGVVFLIVVIAIILFCRYKTRRAPLADDDISKKPLNPALLSDVQPTPPHTLTSRGGGKSSQSGLLSIGGSSVSGLAPYDRNHVTGASSSSSTGTQYPHETLNPPPSPVTERSAHTGCGGGGSSGAGGQYCSSHSVSTVRSARKHHHHHHHHRPHRSKHHHHHQHIPPPPNTPPSTDVCEDSEPHPGKRFRYYFNNSLVELNYDSDPYPPPPTPRRYFSDDVSCPPSPSTERSYYNPYPPPPSPVGHSDC